jgi:hypothetical protein
MSSIDACLFSIASMVVTGEKLGRDLQIGQPVCCGSGWEPFVSGAVDPFNSIDNYVKGCHMYGLS